MDSVNRQGWRGVYRIVRVSVYLLAASLSIPPASAVCIQMGGGVLTLHLRDNPQLAAPSLRAGLPPTERWRICQDTANLTIYVNLLGVLSGSATLKLLEKISRSAVKPIMISFDEPNQPIGTLVGVQTGTRVRAIPFRKVFGRENYVGVHPDGAYGQTLLPRTDFPVQDRLYSLFDRHEIHIATDQSDLDQSGSAFHELAHIGFGPGHSTAISDIQKEAIANAAR